MDRLIQQYLQIALFRATPQQLPGQSIAMWVSVLVAFVTGMAGLLFAYTFSEALGRSVLSLIVPAGLVYLVLRFRSQQHRFNQTFSAMCGSAAIIYILALPLMPYFFNADAQTQSGKWLIMLVLVIDVWALLITAHIVRHALDIGFATAVSLSIALMLITLLLIESIAPQPSRIDNNEVEDNPVALLSPETQCASAAFSKVCINQLITDIT